VNRRRKATPRGWSRRTRLQLVIIALLVALVVVIVAVRACSSEDATTSTGTAATSGGTVLETTTTGVGGQGSTATQPSATAGATSTEPSDSTSPPAAGGIDATLVEVVDGDTIWVRLSDGSEEKVRYIGIDAPELPHEDAPGEYLGAEATAHNAELLASGRLRLETDVEERDDFGRLLAYVWAGDVFVNERMVFDGYARAHNYAPNLGRQEELWAAHDAARAAGRGIWGEETE